MRRTATLQRLSCRLPRCPVRLQRTLPPHHPQHPHPPLPQFEVRSKLNLGRHQDLYFNTCGLASDPLRTYNLWQGCLLPQPQRLRRQCEHLRLRTQQRRLTHLLAVLGGSGLAG
mmetsp:Transcript_21274/g.59450  ORF Transcript_21274/g.59450 Transcript_21274/m.59450 type:complete len:114 (-) Transcript_21274:1087-1428(-)